MSTLVSLHAHPDDEALWTGGTLAGAAAAGHRVVLVVATDGEAGLADAGLAHGLGRLRLAELDRSAAALGVARIVRLGHRDSGSGTPTAGGFATLPVARVAEQVAAVLREEGADLLTSYDAAGGYGHPDHVQVNRVARTAVALLGADAPRLLEATVERERVLPVARLLRAAGRVLPVPRVPDLTDAFTPRSRITHRLDVRDQLPAKLSALEAHGSQRTGGPRTAALLLGLPGPLQRRVLGREWFAEWVPGGVSVPDHPWGDPWQPVESASCRGRKDFLVGDSDRPVQR
ncbi:PIG-L deacetylase family protein [Nocardioides bruguierae]|uniref:PIG-L family deacetylase n=1 Tax=Nocardioides bruguierae TaxID=2945102 RepID=A0A9X2D4S4_9ACTN|nr:PIG-L family deacetylase [Nocardioides bruguierae]MCM0619290.1 PIG-L family deacetylase [Nocardioides bruguierae]